MQQIGNCRRPSSPIGGKSTPISTLLLNLTIANAHEQLHRRSLPEPASHHRCHDHQCQDQRTWNMTVTHHNDLGHQTEVTRISTSPSSPSPPPPPHYNLVRSSTITRITLDRASDPDDSDDDATAEDSRPITNHQEYHERLAVAEALARTSMMTSPAARRRLAARQVEMDLIAGGDDLDYDHIDYVPPKQLLMYMVR